MTLHGQHHVTKQIMYRNKNKPLLRALIKCLVQTLIVQILMYFIGQKKNVGQKRRKFSTALSLSDKVFKRRVKDKYNMKITYKE